MIRTNRNSLSIGLTLIGLVMAMPASAAFSRNGDSSVVFKATGPAGLSFEGKSNAINVKDNGASLIVTVKLDAFATGIELRDRHMKEKYLETAKYPTASLEVDKGRLQLPAGSAVSAAVEGKLTLHGVTRPVRVSYRADGDPKNAKVIGSMHINMKDFKIEVPSYLGVTVKPNVDVDVKMGVVDK